MSQAKEISKSDVMADKLRKTVDDLISAQDYFTQLDYLQRSLQRFIDEPFEESVSADDAVLIKNAVDFGLIGLPGLFSKTIEALENDVLGIVHDLRDIGDQLCSYQEKKGQVNDVHKESGAA